VNATPRRSGCGSRRPSPSTKSTASPTIVSSHLLVNGQVNGLDGPGFHAAVEEAAALCPVSRLFSGARISIEALLEPN
jgi:organic hydroperoxide reductase OsmC/OhrA